MSEIKKERFLSQYPALFDAGTSRLLNSPNVEEQRLIFLGFSLDGQHAVLMPRAVLFRHAHILGDPGSGKTARGLAPLMSQLIGSGEVSVDILDGKGDMTLFQNAKEESERAGLPFKFFTNRVGRASHIWNPFAETFVSRMSFAQRSQQIIAATGLDHGEIYGGGFFTSSMRLVTANILERYSESIHSIADLYRFCADGNAYKGLGPKQDWLNSRHLIAALSGLAGILPLNATPKGLPNAPKAMENAISVEQTLTRPMVNYFFLPSTVDSNQATSIMRLRLYSLLNGAAIYQQERRTVDVIAIIDEAQQIATQGLPLILNQARSHRLGCVLAHQSLDQLKIGSDVDLTQIVLSATGFKQVFRSSDMLSREYLQKSGGEAMYHKLGWSQPVPVDDDEVDQDDISPSAAPKDLWAGHPVVNVQEEIRPRLEPNTIMQVSSDSALSLVNFTEDSGPVQYASAWTSVISGFHIDSETYRRRGESPWPEPDASTVIVPQEWRPATAPPTIGKGPKPDALDSRVQDGLKRLRETSNAGS